MFFCFNHFVFFHWLTLFSGLYYAVAYHHFVINILLIKEVRSVY